MVDNNRDELAHGALIAPAMSQEFEAFRYF